MFLIKEKSRGLPVKPGSKRATMVMGGGGAPQAHSFALDDLACKLNIRGHRRKSYIPAEKALGGDWLSSKKVCSEDGRQKNLQPSSK